MKKSDLPLILLSLVFLAMLSVLFVEFKDPPKAPSIEPKPIKIESFTGRMIMPSIDDLYVLDNSSGRDLEQFIRFLQGRAAGLHYLASDVFKNKKQKENIELALKLTLDSLGHFAEPEILFSNIEDQAFQTLLKKHISTYWQYPRSTAGKFEAWVPMIWKREWDPSQPNVVNEIRLSGTML
ncbi:MAG: hypothetical protein HUK20_04950 [Fibrobacter sp.]|nr:hypothetical protein [Fibrobacter sp.]